MTMMTLKELEEKWHKPQTLWDTWISAMASGRYKKGKGYLIRDSCYCALGVLVEVSGYPGERSEDHPGAVMFDGLHSSLPTTLGRFMDMRAMGDLKEELKLVITQVPLVTITTKSLAGISDASGETWPLERLAGVIDGQRKNLLPFGMRMR